MDMAFLRRAQRMLDKREPAPLDFPMLLASLAAQRAAGDGAQAKAVICEGPRPGEEEPLVELLVAGSGWREAVSAQQGCFSRAEVKRRVNVR